MSYKAIRLPSAGAPSLKTTVYGGFRGVDFKSDSSTVDYSRSPDAKNFICGHNGTIEKRPGWTVVERFGQKINGIYSAVLSEQEISLCHAGDKLYRFDMGNSVAIKTGINDGTSSGFYYNKAGEEALYILTGKEYLKYDGETVSDVCEDSYVPLIAIACAPSGGGEVYESPNLLSAGRRQQFIGDSTSKTLKLLEKGLDSTPVKIKVQTKDGEIEIYEGSHFTVNRTDGVINLTMAYPTPVEGQDNIYVTYQKTILGAKEKITEATLCTTFGLYGSDQVFVAGNPAEKAVDRWSQTGNPTYFPDTNYVCVGEPDSAIVGYASVGSNLAIVKGAGDSRCIYTRTPFLKDDSVEYILEETSVGQAAYPGSVVSMAGESLYVSNDGIVGITASNGKITTKNRGSFFGDKLKDYSHGQAGRFGSMYIFAVDGKAFVLESKYREGTEKDTGDYGYRCYYWDNIPANCFYFSDRNGVLLFGTDNGRVCAMHDKRSDSETVSEDGGEYVEGDIVGGTPIEFRWSTKNDDDGSQINLKEMQPDKSAVVMKSNTLGYAKLLINSDGERVSEEEMPIDRAGYIETRHLRDGGDEYVNRQITVIHDGPGSFELLSITKTFAVTGFGGE